MAYMSCLKFIAEVYWLKLSYYSLFCSLFYSLFSSLFSSLFFSLFFSLFYSLFYSLFKTKLLRNSIYTVCLSPPFSSETFTLPPKHSVTLLHLTYILMAQIHTSLVHSIIILLFIEWRISKNFWIHLQLMEWTWSLELGTSPDFFGFL